MGKPREQGGVTGWVPYHPAIARAIAARIPAHQQNLAPACVLFLTVCYQMRGRSTIVGGGWFEKTRPDWSESLGVSLRIVDHIINLMCYDEGNGQPLPNAKTCLGLVRKRAGGFRNSSQYLVDELRTNQFWLTQGPQPALSTGQTQLEAPDEVVTPTLRQVVTPTLRQVVTPTLRPHQKHIENNMENIINSDPAEDDDVLPALLKLYGFTDFPTIKGTAAKLANIAGADLTIYLAGELAHIEADRRAGTKYAIANLPGWICRQLQQVDPAASELTLTIADERIAAALVAAGHGQRRPVGVDDTADQRSHRRAEFERITGRTDETAPADTHDDDQAAAALAEIERRRLARMARQRTG